MPLDRRSFLKLGGAGILGVSLSSLLSGCEEYIITPIGSGGAAPYITPVDLFFVQNGGQGSISGWSRPTLAMESWELRIEGLAPDDASNPLTITFQDLMESAAAGEKLTVLKTIQCVLESPLRLTPTGFMGNAYWTGVPLKYFLDQAGLSDRVKRILFYGADEFTNNVTLERVMNAEADGLLPPLLVYEMNGQPLTHEHGFPVRLIVEEGFGYKNVKWLTKVQATKFDVEFGTYQDQGFVDDGVIRVNSRSTVIREGATISAGPVEISGYAVSGYAPIAAVEVRIDGGAFERAEIVPLADIRAEGGLPETIEQIAEGDPYPYRAVWAKWRYRWNAPAGNHEVAIRATDTLDNTQPDVDTSVHDGQSGITKYNITVR